MIFLKKHPQSAEGYTALHLAAVSGHVSVVSLIAPHPGSQRPPAQALPRTLGIGLRQGPVCVSVGECVSVSVCARERERVCV